MQHLGCKHDDANIKLSAVDFTIEKTVCQHPIIKNYVQLKLLLQTVLIISTLRKLLRWSWIVLSYGCSYTYQLLNIFIHSMPHEAFLDSMKWLFPSQVSSSGIHMASMKNLILFVHVFHIAQPYISLQEWINSEWIYIQVSVYLLFLPLSCTSPCIATPRP